jgi:hypothetical protein
LFSLPGGTEMVHFPPFASAELCVHSVMAGYCPAGLPHSEIPGSKPACGSPRLIAAYRVLHRLSAPRHPPCTLSSLTKLESLLPANPIAFNPIQLSTNPLDPCEIRAGLRLPETTAHPARPAWIQPKNPRLSSPTHHQIVVELIGFEPTTSALQGRRSPI